MNSTIVVIDDNQMMLTLLENYLSTRYSIHTFTAASQALLTIQQGLQPDLILTDLNMPGLNGLSFLRKIKSNSTTALIPVIVLSGSEKSETRIECLNAGADDFLPKPFHLEELRIRIQKSVDRPIIEPQAQPLKAKVSVSKLPIKSLWAKRFFKEALAILLHL